MEVAKIDWQRIESVFVEDQVYENINAPQWVDLLSPLPGPADDIAWFCRSDCRHPRTAEDFLNSTPPSPFKLLRSASVSKLIGLVDWTRRGEPDLGRRGVPHSSTSNGDSENQDPNFPTPSRQISYLNKAVIKSSVYKSEEEDEYTEILLEDSHEKIKPVLKSTHSAKDLIRGSNIIFGKINEICNNLKNMATRAKENEEKLSPDPNNFYKPVEPKERLPLLEVGKDRIEAVEAEIKSSAKGKARKNKIKQADETENVRVSLNMNNNIQASCHCNIKRKEEKVLPIRTNPPTPQGFSANRRPFKTTPPSKSPKSRLMERETVDEAGQKKSGKEEEGETRNGVRTRTLDVDVFWLFKPCTTISS